MAKLIKKDKCKFEAGIIVKKNKQIGLPYNVWCQLNKLEVMLQQYMYLKGQPAYCKGPSLNGFERETALTSDRPYVNKPETPTIDRRMKEALEFMEETDAVNDAQEINSAIDDFGALIDWCAAKKFIEGDCYKLIDTPQIGNPLALGENDIVRLLTILVKDPVVIAGA